MKDTIKIYKELSTVSGRKDKENILSSEKGNLEFRYILNFLLDKNVITGISLKKINKQAQDAKKTEDFDTLIDLLEYVKNNNTGKNEVIDNVLAWIEKQPEETRDFYKAVITKKLKCGVDVKTALKIYGSNFVPNFFIQLGTSIEHCKIEEGEKFFISQKLNGNRCVWYCNEFLTRQGKKFTGLDHIKKDIEMIFNSNYDVVLDGELIRKNIDNKSDSENFQIGTGIANSDAEKKEELKYVIFDIITKKDLEICISELTYGQRKEKLIQLENIIRELQLENIEIVNMLYEGTDQSEIWKALEYAETVDWEGVIVNLDMPYECKRTTNLIKVKEFYTCDLEIIGIEKGKSSGKYSNTLGAFVVDFKGNPVNVGSGISDELRDEYFNSKEDLIGRVIEVKYKEITRDKKTGKESLQFPIFCGLREKGKEVSYE